MCARVREDTFSFFLSLYCLAAESFVLDVFRSLFIAALSTKLRLLQATGEVCRREDLVGTPILPRDRSYGEKERDEEFFPASIPFSAVNDLLTVQFRRPPPPPPAETTALTRSGASHTTDTRSGRAHDFTQETISRNDARG